MIPIKEAISSGAWLHCEFDEYNRNCQFRIKVLSFRKLKLTEIDEPENINFIDKNTILWMMELEVINLTKEPIRPSYELDKLILIDHDGYAFYLFDDIHVRSYSNFARKSGMYRFHAIDLIPKIKAIGAIPFQLPDDDEASYSISIKSGIIREA